MAFLLYVFSTVAVLLITVVLWLMIARMILGFLTVPDDNAIIRFIYLVTEAVTLPMHYLLERFEWVQTFPLDLSYTATFLVLAFLRILFQSL